MSDNFTLTIVLAGLYFNVLELRQYFLIYFIAPVLFTGVITTVAACMNVLGQDNSVGTGGWCWIKNGINDDTQIMWMFVSGKGWELLCYLTTGVLYFMCKLTIVLKVIKHLSCSLMTRKVVLHMFIC